MASNEPRMSKGSTATNTRTVGGKLSTTAGPQAHGAAWRPKHRRRTRPERCRPKERNGPVPARAMSLQVRARPKCAQWALPLSMLFAASSATSCRAARYSSARRGASAHRRRARAPISRRSCPCAPPPADTAPLPARPRSSVQLTIATSVLRSSLNPARLEIIPPWLMGHCVAHWTSKRALHQPRRHRNIQRIRQAANPLAKLAGRSKRMVRRAGRAFTARSSSSHCNSLNSMRRFF